MGSIFDKAERSSVKRPVEDGGSDGIEVLCQATQKRRRLDENANNAAVHCHELNMKKIRDNFAAYLDEIISAFEQKMENDDVAGAEKITRFMWGAVRETRSRHQNQSANAQEDKRQHSVSHSQGGNADPAARTQGQSQDSDDSAFCITVGGPQLRNWPVYDDDVHLARETLEPNVEPNDSEASYPAGGSIQEDETKVLEADSHAIYASLASSEAQANMHEGGTPKQSQPDSQETACVSCQDCDKDEVDDEHSERESPAGSQGTELEWPPVEEPFPPPPPQIDRDGDRESYSESDNSSPGVVDPDSITEFVRVEPRPPTLPIDLRRSAPPPWITDPGNKKELFSHVRKFCPENDFVFVAGVCKAWKRMWTDSGRPPKTSVREALSTLARVKEQLNPQQLALDEVAIRCGGIFALAAREGNLEGLKFAVNLRHYREEWNFWKHEDSGVTAAAAARGSLEMLQWAHETEGCAWDRATFNNAAACGHVDIFRWLKHSGCPRDESTCAEAARAGRLNTLRLLKELQCPWDGTTCSAAAAGGHLDVLKWARGELCHWDENTCAEAAAGGHLRLLKWARENGCPWDANTWAKAASGGHLEVLKYAYKKTCPRLSYRNVMYLAAENGHLNVMRWVNTWGEYYDNGVCRFAAQGGKLDVLQWLRHDARKARYPLNYETFTHAALNGHMEIFQWAKANGYAWRSADKTCCANAAKNGHLDLLKWMRAEGFSWDETKMCTWAAQGGNVRLLEWVKSEGCSWNRRQQVDVCRAAAIAGHLELLKWVRSQGCCWKERTISRYAARHPVVLWWLKRQA